MVKCLECGVIASFQGKEEKDAACKAWNKRTSAYERAVLDGWDTERKDNDK